MMFMFQQFLIMCKILSFFSFSLRKNFSQLKVLFCCDHSFDLQRKHEEG